MITKNIMLALKLQLTKSEVYKMRQNKKLVPVWVLFILIVPVVMLGSCGKNNGTPDGATITINGPTQTLAIADNTTQDYSVVARYADGTPIPKAPLRITGGFAEPRNATNTTTRYQFYFFPGGENNPNNLKVDTGFEAQTDDRGVYNFSVTIFGTVGGVANSFQDTIVVSSGTAFGSIALAVN
jgi:hypothetical protein